MGCCGQTNIKYQHDGKTQAIGAKQAVTIDRFAKGSIARIRTK